MPGIESNPPPNSRGKPRKHDLPAVHRPLVNLLPNGLGDVALTTRRRTAGMPDWEQRIELALRQGARIDSSHGRLITGLAPCLPLCGAGPLLTLFRLTSATKEELEDYASSSPQGPSVANDMAAHNALVMLLLPPYSPSILESPCRRCPCPKRL